MAFLSHWHKEYLEKVLDQNKLWRSLWNNSRPLKTYYMKLFPSTAATLWKKFILILTSVNFSCTQTDELLKEKAWDEVKRGNESGQWMGLYVRRLVSI